MAYSTRDKQYIYKWREAHKDQYNEYLKQKSREQYEHYKDRIKHNRMARYYYQKEAELYRYILL